MWIWLATRYSSYSTTPKKLIEHFGTPYNAFHASEEEYKILTRKPEPLFDKDIERAIDIAEYIKRNNIGIITYNDPQFPSALKALENSPILLYYVGTLYDFESAPSVGVVGTRRYTPQGERITKRVAYDLARSGFTVVSGLAKGIDSFSHKAALYNKSMTAAVLGCGIDVIYPPENRELTLRLYENGLVLTEFPPGTPPSAWNFPARNRIISALSDGIFVAECTLKSGTIITADHAFKHNTPVYMYDKLCGDAEGYLKSRGAVSITHADCITADFKPRYPELRLISELPTEQKLLPEESVVISQPLEKFNSGTVSKRPAVIEITPAATSEFVPQPAPAKPCVELSDEEKSVLKLFDGKTVCIDKLADNGISVADLLRILTSLEIKGVITSLPGGNYIVNT